MPEGPEAERLHLIQRRLLEGTEGIPEHVVAVRVLVGRGEVDHDLGERGGGGVASQVGGQAHGKMLEIEGREHVQLAVLLGEVLGLPLAQELERRTEAAVRPESALRDGALDAVLPGGESDDLRRLTVAKRRAGRSPG